MFSRGILIHRTLDLAHLGCSHLALSSPGGHCEEGVGAPSFWATAGSSPHTHLLISSTQGWPQCRRLQETLQAPLPVPLLSDRRTLLAPTLYDMLVVYLLPSSAGFLSKLCSKPVFLNLPMYPNRQRCLLKAQIPRAPHTQGSRISTGGARKLDMYGEAQVIVKSGRYAALLKKDHSLTPFLHHLISS